MTGVEIEGLATGFLDHSLPVARWTHHAHCLVTAWLHLRRPDIDLDRELPDLIRRYNEASGGRNTDSAGYHHTITLFYLGAIREFLAGQDGDTAEKCGRLLASAIGDKDFPLRYYSRERLFSKEARLGWLEPDIAVFSLDAIQAH